MPAFIMLLVQGLLGGLALSLPQIITRLAVSLGVGVVSFTGLNFLLNQLKTLAFAQLQGMPLITTQAIGILNIDVAFSIVMSAYAMKLSIKLLGGSTMKAVGLK